jgi:hypothetical protein
MLDYMIAAQRKYRDELMARANVINVGVGYMVSEGETTDELGLIVGVTKKLPCAQLRASEELPRRIGSVPIDVQQLGRVKAGGAGRKRPVKPKPQAELSMTDKHRPAFPGVSIGHFNITAGTFGLVVNTAEGHVRILTNNHVGANGNEASIGDRILQPGPIDGGSTDDEIGVLDNYIPIWFDGHPQPDPPGGGNGEQDPPKPKTCPISSTVISIVNACASVLGSQRRVVEIHKSKLNSRSASNLVDAALIQPTDHIQRAIHKIGLPTGIDEAVLGTSVQKTGRTTDYTTGQVVQVNATVQVSYGGSNVATFHDQIITGPMSEGGDSGSALLYKDNRVIGLLFAGSPDFTIFNRIQDVMEALNITVAL